ncbi:MAG TPA: hypothetical protein VF245_00750 [Solirubrobacterales bacterium]
MCAATLAAMPSSAFAATPRNARTPEQAIAYLNQQRASYGIPPVTLDQSLLKPECNLANHEIAASFSPSEFPWGAYVSPWSNAPWHEQILFDPSDVAAAYGVYSHFGQEAVLGARGAHWVCMWFSHDWSQSGPPRFYWVSEASGPKAVPASLGAYEWPSTPAQDLGLPNPTGPNISVYALGAAATQPEAVATTVVGPSGQTVPTHLIAKYPHAAMLVVDRPLQEGTSYSVTVTWRGYFGPNPPEVVDQIQSFAFTTAREIRSQLKLLNGGRKGGRNRVWISSNEVLGDQKAELSVAVAQRRCGRQLKRPRPGCLWITTRRQTKTIVLSAAKIAMFAPTPSPRRRVHVRVAVKRFRNEEGFVKGAGASLQLR